MSTVPETTVAEPTRSEGSISRHLGIAIVAFAIAYLPLVYQHFATLWQRPQYQYFPFVLAAFGYMLGTRWKSSARHVSRASAITALHWAVLGTAWVMLLVGVYMYDPWLGAASAVLTSAIVLSLVSDRRVTNMWGIWCLLWLIIPLPLDLDQKLVLNLQALSSKLSSGVLDLIGINHLMAGNVLQLPDKQFFVDEACSGIVSVMSVVTAGAIYAVWFNRSLLHTLSLLLSGVAWAVALNVARIVTIAFAHDKGFSYDLSEGTPHEILGLVLFCLTFLALVSSDRVLEFILAPVDVSDTVANEAKRNPLILLWNRTVRFLTPGIDDEEDATESVPRSESRVLSRLPWIAGGFALLGIVHAIGWSLVENRAGFVVNTMDAIDGTEFGKNIGDWELTSFETIERDDNSGYGDRSKSFGYRHAKLGLTVLASIDFPFRGSWHELTNCYGYSGWNLTRRTVESPPDGAWRYTDADFDMQPEQYGHLLYSIIDDSGDEVSPPTDGIQASLWRRMRRRGPKSVWPTMLQCQVWHQANAELNDRDRQEVLAFFLQFRTKMMGLAEAANPYK